MKILRNEKGFAPVVIAVILGVIVAAGYVGYQYISGVGGEQTGELVSVTDPIGENPDIRPPTPTPNQDSHLEPNFETGGMLFDENRVTGAKEWTFMYDEPGRMAILIKVKFTETSTCDLGMGVGTCNLGDYNIDDYNDAYFELSGYREGEEVTVISLVLHRI